MYLQWRSFHHCSFSTVFLSRAVFPLLYMAAVLAMARAVKDMEKDTRDALYYAFALLLRSNVKALLEDWQEGNEKKAEKKRREK